LFSNLGGGGATGSVGASEGGAGADTDSVVEGIAADVTLIGVD